MYINIQVIIICLHQQSHKHIQHISKYHTRSYGLITTKVCGPMYKRHFRTAAGIPTTPRHQNGSKVVAHQVTKVLQPKAGEWGCKSG